MFLLPIGHTQTTVRRLPWVTFGLMAMCLVAFVLSGRANPFPKADRDLQEDVFGTAEWYLEHPYLELDPEFERLFLSNVDKEQLAAVLETAQKPPRSPGSAATLQLEQERLDELTLRTVKAFGSHPLMRWGLTPNHVKPVTVITHMFLHAGWFHFLGNLLILFLTGPFIEDVWGRPLYAGFYLASGLVAALFHVLASAGSTLPMIGASGAIAGVMGAFLVRYWSAKIRFFYLVLIIRGTFSAPAWVMLPLWFALQLAFGLVAKEMGLQSGVAYWAHVGGFVAGAGTALFLGSQRIEERFIHPNIENKLTLTVEENQVVDEALEVRQAGDHESAFRMLCMAVMNQPGNHDGAAALWELALELNRTAEAAPLMLRSVNEQLRSGDGELAVHQWLDVQRTVRKIEGDSRVLVRLAQALQNHKYGRESLVPLRWALDSGGSDLDPILALKIARAARPHDLKTARTAAELGLRQPTIDPAIRVETEQLLRELPSGQIRS